MKMSMCQCLSSQSPKAEVKLVQNVRNIFCEFLGTAMLLFLGCMGCIESNDFQNSRVIKSVNFGFIVLIIIQCFGCCSGAHLNPAVTLASYIYDMLSLPMAFAYSIAQVLGAICGYGLLKALMPVDLVQGAGASDALCLTTIHPSIATWQAVCIEMFITAALMCVCCGVWDARNKMWQDSVAIRFGLTVAALSITAGPFTGASMNPARSLAPAIWSNQLKDQWVYWVAPLLSSFISALSYKYVFGEQETIVETSKAKKNEVQTSCP